MTVRVRFAPSPTGNLHVGNVRTALVNWLLARRAGGSFLLRMDDTDTGRSSAAFEQSIMDDLAWLGLHWDDFARQSERQERYDAAVERLKGSGRLYPCYETPEELALKRKIMLSQGRPPVYDRAARRMTDEQREALEAEGRQPHWRFELASEPVQWSDQVRGHVRFEPGHLSDPVLLREDGRPLYTLSSVVDDGELGITDVVRGEDHVANTAVQVQVFQALGFPVPRFAHLPLMSGPDGSNLSKRLGSLGVAELREQGIQPLAVAGYLARLGTSRAPTGAERLEDLAADFELAAFGRASPAFDPAELRRLNLKVLHQLDFADVRDRLPAGVDAPFWEAVRPNIESLDDVADWHAICRGDIPAAGEDPDFLAQAAAVLPKEPWDEDTFRHWTDAVKDATGAKGKALFLPLRRALTGRDHGPELKVLLPLIGRDRVLARLK